MATDLAVGSFFYLIGSFSSPHDLPLWTIRHVCRIAAARKSPGQGVSASLGEIADDYNDHDRENDCDADLRSRSDFYAPPRRRRHETLTQH